MKKTVISFLIVLFLWVGICYGWTIYTGNRLFVGNVGINGELQMTDGNYTNKIINSPAEGLAGADLRIGLDEALRTLIIADIGDIATDFGLTAATQPTLKIYSADGTNPITLANGAITGVESLRNSVAAATTMYFKYTGDTTGTPVFSFTQYDNTKELTASSGAQIFLDLSPEILHTSTASYTALLVNPTESSVGSGTNLIMDLQVGGTSKFNVRNTGIINTNMLDAASVAPARATQQFIHTAALAADANDACGGTADCLTLPIPTTMGYLEMWTNGNLYLSAVVVNAGTSTVITDSDAAGVGVEYQAAIGDCTGLCLHDGGTNATIFNDTAGAVTVTVKFTYD